MVEQRIRASMKGIINGNKLSNKVIKKEILSKICPDNEERRKSASPCDIVEKPRQITKCEMGKIVTK